MYQSPFEPIDIPDHAWQQESTRQILRNRVAGPLFAFAQKYGISQTRLAVATGVSQARINDLIKGRRGNITAIEAWIRIADGLNMPDHARAIMGLAPAVPAGATASGRSAATTRPLSAPQGISSLLSEIISTDTNDEAIDQLSRAASSLAESHTQVPAQKALAQVLRLHTETQTLLQRQQSLRQKRELYQIESHLLAHACLLFGDLDKNAAADEYGEASLVFAQEAGANEAIAWTVRAKTLRWQERFIESADMARRGYDCSPATPLRVQLASQEANAAALLGDVKRAREAMKRAEAAAESIEPDSGVSAWSFPAARQAIFALSVAIHTDDPDSALRASAMAHRAWESGVPRVPATWAQIQAGTGIAHLMKDSLDQAVQAVTPVLALPPEFRVATVTAYLKDLDHRLGNPRFGRSKDTLALRRDIQDFITAAPVLPEAG
jgi:tetratricopeptide (TPR) repeat protein/predicted XRE-type DNA-binding protein